MKWIKAQTWNLIKHHKRFKTSINMTIFVSKEKRRRKNSMLVVQKMDAIPLKA
jgi:hypothetical protein